MVHHGAEGESAVRFGKELHPFGTGFEWLVRRGGPRQSSTRPFQVQANSRASEDQRAITIPSHRSLDSDIVEV